MKHLVSIWENYVNDIQKKTVLNEAVPPKETLEKIQSLIIKHGGKPYIVGGAVRDELIPGAPESKDVDYVVTGLPLDDLGAVLVNIGDVSEVGKSFGILKSVIDGYEFDFSIPRVEKKTGLKHTDFEITTDPNASIEDDLARRDFTMNAISKDSKGNLIDIYGGVEDIKNKLIRAVGNPSERFKEDPLRMLRAIQFAIRLGFEIEEETKQAIKRNFELLRSIPAERIYMEFEKAWTKGKKDSTHFINLLSELEIGDWLFGLGFRPLAMDSFPDGKKNFLANFVAFFLRGGTPDRMRPTKEMLELLELAKRIVKYNDMIWKVYGVTREKLELLEGMFEKLKEPQYKQLSWKINKVLNHPLGAKEIDINGIELMKLGYSGPQIGKVFNQLVTMIQKDEIKNNYDDIVNYVGR